MFKSIYSHFSFILTDECETPSDESCLILVKELKTWFNARSHCLDIGGDLFHLKRGETLTGVGIARNSTIFQKISQSSFNVHIGIVKAHWEWNGKLCI